MTDTNNNQITPEQELANTLGNITNEQLTINQVFGRVATLNALANTIEAFSLIDLSEIKEKKLYRHFNNQTIVKDGMQVPMNTWAGFCRAINSSDKTIDDKLANLKVLGAEALEKSEAMGITTRQLRNIRKLDETDQQVVIGEIEANVGDKDSIIELIEDMTVKHAKDKDKLTAKVKTLEQEAKAKDKVNADRQNTINKLNNDITAKDEKLALKLDAPVHDRAVDYLEQLETLKGDALKLNGKFKALFTQAEQDDEMLALIRVNMGHAMLEISSNANDLIDAYHLSDTLNKGIDLDYLALVNAQATNTDNADDNEQIEDVSADYEMPEWAKADK